MQVVPHVLVGFDIENKVSKIQSNEEAKWLASLLHFIKIIVNILFRIYPLTHGVENSYNLF